MDKKSNYKLPEEWFRQAQYDMDTARAMFDSGRYIYTVFMCHLSIEKALKGFYAKQHEVSPPKIHDLIYLLKKINIDIQDEQKSFIEELNELSVASRYPEDLGRILRDFKKDKTKNLLNNSENLLKWLLKNI